MSEDIVTERPHSPVRVIFSVRITCEGIKGKKRIKTATPKAQDHALPVRITSSPSAPDSSSKTTRRTQNLLSQQDARMERIQVAGAYEKQITDRWQCHDENCNNWRGFCWVDPTDHLHYNMTAIHQQSWANAIRAGDATLTSPPVKLVRVWQQDGAVNKLARRPKQLSAAQQSKSMMESFQETQKQIMEMTQIQMQMEMQEQMQRNNERRSQRQEQREMAEQVSMARPPYGQSSLYGRGFDAGTPFQFPGSDHHRTPVDQFRGPPSDINHPPTTFANTEYRPQSAQDHRPRQASVAPISQSAPSSPINTDEDDIEIVIKFFDWKIRNTQSEIRQDKLMRAKETIVQNDWTLDDMKTMSDPDTRLYSLALAKGITDGMARQFKSDLRLFKSEVKGKGHIDAARTASALLDMRNPRVTGTGGGFLPPRDDPI
ncbi:hypothetical protein P152DRAFT_129658 [Eremomyces bilateralis CBS 781.70]|uniref:Uncharacterized protein n=1 Tax=Eremomyces bilateralis CBS 781.70 TaxID=1392243 RepID=A0A6G1GER7_9PEZI|nr:uncharacterized protein P152DRAFT_129658 [Eremomyces bilateralis CBS 781.70]KAF1816605.1 hypothetical protein P152DRAFT_129658 [Eremomyces bilateralis CBS 781.70]